MSTNTLAGRDCLRLLDLTPEEFVLVLDTAARQKAAWRDGVHDAPCTGKAVAIIMEKPSLRTRSSFEIGTYRLGAHPLVMSDDHSAFSRGETVQDTTLVLERFVDAIVLRTFEQEKVEEVARWASVPVINALTDEFHPCQGLADALTIREHKGALAGLTIAYVGDGNNMAHTYLEMGVLAGMHVKLGFPAIHAPNSVVVAECEKVAPMTGTTIELFNDPREAVSGADVVITDTWTSMGDEAEHDKRLAEFEGFQVNAGLMDLAADDALFMHCLPAHRGEEVTDEVIDAPCSVVFDEAENRLHAQKALLSLVMGVQKHGRRTQAASRCHPRPRQKRAYPHAVRSRRLPCRAWLRRYAGDHLARYRRLASREGREWYLRAARGLPATHDRDSFRARDTPSAKPGAAPVRPGLCLERGRGAGRVADVGRAR